MAKPGSVIGWKLPRDDREKLLRRVEPEYDKVLADHLPLSTAATPDTALPPKVKARIVGRADDGDSLEFLVVEIDGTTDRPDGSTYHITWSFGPGRNARESNDVLRQCGWQSIDEPIPI